MDIEERTEAAAGSHKGLRRERELEHDADGRGGAQQLGRPHQHVELGALDIQLDEIDRGNALLEKDIVQPADLDAALADAAAYLTAGPPIPIGRVRRVQTARRRVAVDVQRRFAVFAAERARHDPVSVAVRPRAFNAAAPGSNDRILKLILKVIPV